MELATRPNPDPRAVLTKALLNAGRTLGLSQEALGDILGGDRSSIARGLDPDSKAGEPALPLIRCCRSLYSLVGGRQQDMCHWMHNANRDICGIPAEQVRSVAGLVRVVEYLDAMRGNA
ncbi:antitoxin Xre/MbcA/ParS toxin-binding domain-containing protein [Thiocapsa sp.]|uniref:MbcA/ParS/Xre antitoxin family protein n=1 Tax=Thiocapsa sp. TaxID=2024551 RepID=UPI0035930D74